MNDSTTAPEPAHLVHVYRGRRVLLDADLARLCGVSLRRVLACSRYFPGEFCFNPARAELFRHRPDVAFARADAVVFTEAGVVAIALTLGVPDAPALGARLVRLLASTNAASH